MRPLAIVGETAWMVPLPVWKDHFSLLGCVGMRRKMTVRLTPRRRSKAKPLSSNADEKACVPVDENGRPARCTWFSIGSSLRRRCDSEQGVPKHCIDCRPENYFLSRLFMPLGRVCELLLGRRIDCQGVPGRPRGSPVQYTVTCNTGKLVLYGRPSRSPWQLFTDPVPLPYSSALNILGL